MSETGFMLDTNVFDTVTKKRLAWSSTQVLFVTHVQRDELGKTGNAALRERLMRMFTDIDPTSLATDTFLLDDSRLDEAKFGGEDDLYDRLLTHLIELDRASGKKSRDLMNQSRDARIAETAIKARLTLVTNDRNLTQATTESGGKVISFEDFCALE